MPAMPPWADGAPGGSSPALFTDLYELTMVQAYVADGTGDVPATFSLFVRTLPGARNFLLAAGLESVLRHLESLRFDSDAIAYLRTLGCFTPSFLDWLARFRFQGSVVAVPEGTPMFAGEPLLEITGGLAEAQLFETLLINEMHTQTMLASKAARVVLAAQGRRVVDFSARRVHGVDASVKGARAFAIAGISATSNLLAGKVHDLPVVGTMAHAYVQSFENEADAFRAFVRQYPDTTLLVDTYDTLQGVRRVVDLARELGAQFKVQAIRLDSGDLATLSKQAREMLDAAGLHHVRIFASGGLDEHALADLLSRGAPIDAFGVGTRMGVSEDAPTLDVVYKLTEFAGRGRMKLSPGKNLLPGRKQIWRRETGGIYSGDVIGRADESLSGTPLLRLVMKEGRRLVPAPPLQQIASYAATELAKLPPPVRSRATAAYPVTVSDSLTAHAKSVQAALRS